MRGTYRKQVVKLFVSLPGDKVLEADDHHCAVVCGSVLECVLDEDFAGLLGVFDVANFVNCFLVGDFVPQLQGC